MGMRNFSSNFLNTSRAKLAAPDTHIRKGLSIRNSREISIRGTGILESTLYNRRNSHKDSYPISYDISEHLPKDKGIFLGMNSTTFF